MIGPGFFEAAFAAFYLKALLLIVALVAGAFALGAWIF